MVSVGVCVGSGGGVVALLGCGQGKVRLVLRIVIGVG